MSMNQKRKIQLSIMLSLIVALAVRWYYYIHWAGLDFWGDAYHHWLISRLTLANQWIYTDYKGLETIWLPGYHYLISAVMFGWERFDLLPAHATNMILGGLACGLVAWLVSDITNNWLVGLGAGLTLALLPWHIAYSHINMPEVMAGVLLLALLLAVCRDWLALLPWLAFVSTLTRHELTLSIFLIGLWLWRQRRWPITRRLWLGSGLGLVVWSCWSWYHTGDLLGWWRRSLNAAAHDARFNNEAGVRLTDIGTLVGVVNQAYPLLAVVGLTAIALIIGIRFYERRYHFPKWAWLLIALVGAHWLVLGRSFVAGYLPVADPRFILVTLPVLVGVGVIAIAAAPHDIIRLSLTALYILMLLVSLSDQMPAFSEMAYIINPERVAGEYLAEIATPEDKYNYWVDAPVAIYYSNLNPQRFFSSDVLLPTKTRYRDDTLNIALTAIKEHNIRYVLWEDVPYTFVGEVWPQMAEAVAFEQNGYRFEPVFRFAGWELDYGAKPTILWQIKEVSPD
jgi:hypothetical protein